MVGVAPEHWHPATRVPVQEHRVRREQQPHGLRVRRACVVVAVAYCGLALVLLALGFLLTHVVDGSVGRWDEHLNRSLLPDRTSTWNAITASATSAMNTLPVVVVVVVLVAVFASRRWWWEAAVVAIGMTLEITVFLSVTFVVARPRPAVPRLNATPATGSFPSGHTAAATVLCVALAYILTQHTRRPRLRAAAWFLAALIVAIVAYGRVYRGLHHPTDVVAGMLLGVSCVVAAVYALRAAAVAPSEAHSHDQ